MFDNNLKMKLGAQVMAAPERTSLVDLFEAKYIDLYNDVTDYDDETAINALLSYMGAEEVKEIKQKFNISDAEVDTASITFSGASQGTYTLPLVSSIKLVDDTANILFEKKFIEQYANGVIDNTRVVYYIGTYPSKLTIDLHLAIADNLAPALV